MDAIGHAEGCDESRHKCFCSMGLLAKQRHAMADMLFIFLANGILPHAKLHFTKVDGMVTPVYNQIYLSSVVFRFLLGCYISPSRSTGGYARDAESLFFGERWARQTNSNDTPCHDTTDRES